MSMRAPCWAMSSWKSAATPTAAIKEYRKVIELQPDSPEAHINLAVAQKKQGELDAAIVSLNKALELKPDSVARAHDTG